MSPAPLDVLTKLRGDRALGALERSAVTKALRSRGLTLDPAPDGKRVGKIVVVNGDVFAPEDGVLTFLNLFHMTTKEASLRREVLLVPGAPWSVARADETERKLRDPIFSSLAVVVPVMAEAESTVDVLVVTRDVFSLRFNSEFRGQNGYLSYLAASLSENNFLGRRKVAAMAFEMDQGEWGAGPLYLDKNLLGKRVTLRANARVLYSRGGLLGPGLVVREGSASSISLAKPFWTLASRWSWSAEVSHRVATERQFVGEALRTYDDPNTPDVETVPWAYRFAGANIGAGLARSFGDAVIQRVRLGYSLEWRRPTLLEDSAAPLPPALAEAFRRDVLPRSERASVVSAGWEVFTPRFVQLRDIASFDIVEDFRLGPSAGATVGLASPLWGSEDWFVRHSLRAGFAALVGRDGLFSADVSGSGRLESGAWIDNSATGQLSFTTPRQRWGRLALRVRISTLWADTQNRAWALGADTGIRGLAVNERIGTRRAVTQLEWRTQSIPFWVTRVGGLVFADAGGADDTFADMRLVGDVGLGLRMLIPQLSPELLRIDIAQPLQGNYVPRVVFGFGAEF